MKNVLLISKLSLSAVALAVMGSVSPEAFAQAQPQVMDARCPNGFTSDFQAGRLHCTRPESRSIVCPNPAFPNYVGITEAAAGSERDVCTSNTVDGRAITSGTNLSATVTLLSPCPAALPRAITHSTAGPICTRSSGVVVGVNDNLSQFTLGSQYVIRTSSQVPRFGPDDFERVPVNGVRNSRSYVATVPSAVTALTQGWRLSLTGSGILDRYQRTAHTSAILVPHQD